MFLETILGLRSPWTTRDDDPLVNVHARTVAGDLATSGALLERLAEPGSVWPRGWPPMRMSDGLQIGSTGGHGPVRYTVTHHVPGRSVRFDGHVANGRRAWHSFELEAVAAGVMWTHTLSIDAPGAADRALMIPLHDQIAEELLDNIAARVEGRDDPLPSRPRGVRARVTVVGAMARQPEPDEVLRGRRPVADALSATLMGAAAVHVLWGSGSSFPAHDRDALGRAVVGGRVPGIVPCLAVAGALTGAAALVQLRVRPRDGVPFGLVDAGVRALAAVLAVRGVAGLGASGLGRSPQPFRTWDLLFYSPLCLLLAGAAARTAGSNASVPRSG